MRIRKEVMQQFIPDNVRKSLTDLVNSLNAYKIKYLIVGAIPVQFYGRPRTSWDVDVTFLTPTTKKKLFKILRPERYELVRGEETVFKFRDIETNSFIDVLLNPSALGLTPESLKRKKKVRISRIFVDIPAPEDYIITKLVARRAYSEDYIDMMSTLENMYDSLDWQYLERRAKNLNIYHLISYYKEGVKWKLKK